MRTHLEMWGFIPSHSLALTRAWNVTPGLHTWPTPSQALAFVASLRLRLQHCDTYWSIRWLGNFEDDLWGKRSCNKVSSLKQASHHQDEGRLTNDYVIKVYQKIQNIICNNGKESGRCSIDPNHVECTTAKLQRLHSNHHHSRRITKLWEASKQIVLWIVQENITCRHIWLSGGYVI